MSRKLYFYWYKKKEEALIAPLIFCVLCRFPSRKACWLVFAQEKSGRRSYLPMKWIQNDGGINTEFCQGSFYSVVGSAGRRDTGRQLEWCVKADKTKHRANQPCCTEPWSCPWLGWGSLWRPQRPRQTPAGTGPGWVCFPPPSPGTGRPGSPATATCLQACTHCPTLTRNTHNPPPPHPIHTHKKKTLPNLPIPSQSKWQLDFLTTCLQAHTHTHTNIHYLYNSPSLTHTHTQTLL